MSGRTVARNLVLLAVALIGLVAAAADGTGRSAAGAVLGIVVAAAVVAGEWLTGQAARRRRDAEAEAAFAEVVALPAPEFRLPTLSGGELGLRELLAPGLPLLLITLSPGCGPCRALRPAVAQWAELLSSRVTVAVLATGDRETNVTSYADDPHLTVLLDETDVRTELGTGGTPSAVVIGPDGVVASGVAAGEGRIRRLLVHTVTGADVDGVEAPGPEDQETEETPADELDLDSTVAARPTVQSFPVGETTVLLEATTGATVALDQIGTLIWSVLDGSGSLREIGTDLAEVFGAPQEQVAADVLALARSLGAAGLLAGVAPGSESGAGSPEPAHSHA